MLLETELQSIDIIDGIVHVKYNHDLRIVDLDVAESLLWQRQRLVGPQKTFPLFVDVNNVKSITREARFFLTTPNAHKGSSALALLVQNPMAKLCANLFLILNPPKVPSKLFLNKQNALRWLRQFRHMN